MDLHLILNFKFTFLARGEKSIKSRFKKKKQKTVANGPIEEHPQQPEVGTYMYDNIIIV